MANLIQIKRSLTASTPASLANGELAFTSNGNILFIGANGAIEAIGGSRNPGVLTANQALVANATSGIDKVIVANAVITSLYANGSSGTAGQVLVSNGTSVFWGTGTSGNNTEIQFNDSGVANGSAGFTFNKTSNTLTVGNNIVVSGNVASSNTTTGAITVSGGVGVTGRINTFDLAAGNTSVYSTLNGNSLTTIDVFSTGTVNAVTLSVGGWVVANNSGVFTSGVVNADVITVGSTFRANTTGLFVDGNTSLGSNSSDIFSINASVNTDIVPSTNATYNIGTNNLRWNEIHAANLHSEYLYIDKDVQISGNLYVTGNVTTINVSSLSVTDSLIQLASNNTASDLIDIGLFGSYNTGGSPHEHAGFFRDATDGVWKLFVGLQDSPNTTVDIAGTGYTKGTLDAYLISGGLVSNGTNLALTANSTLDVAIVANTLSIATPLAATSGGIGHSSYTAGDILVASNTTYLSKLGLGSDGYVLQSNGTSLVYGTLDGGTF